MDLKIKDVAELLHVSESTIRRWITEGKIPAYQMSQHYYFSRTEIENWVISHKLSKTSEGISPFTRREEADSLQLPRSTSSRTGGSKQFALFRAIHKGAVVHALNGKTKEEIIRGAMEKTAKLLQVDADVMTDLLLDRENLMSTALNNGIAIPHTRDSLLPHHQDIVIVAFLKEPIEYGSLDREPVHTLFFLFACEDKRHLHLLAKIAHLSGQPQSREFLQTHPSKEDLLAFIKEWESHIAKVVQDV